MGARSRPALADLAESLEHGAVPSFRFHGARTAPRRCRVPLPMGGLGSAYGNHVELVRKARGAEDRPESFWTIRLMLPGGSDAFLGPLRPDPHGPNEAFRHRFRGARSGDGRVPNGGIARGAARAIRLVDGFVNDVSAAQPHSGRARQGFRLLPIEAILAFSPTARSTPDEARRGLGRRQLRLPLRLLRQRQGPSGGRTPAPLDMTFDFPRADRGTRRRTRPSVRGHDFHRLGHVLSNRDEAAAPAPFGRGGSAYSCIAEIRDGREDQAGEAKTPFAEVGDGVRIEN